MLFQKNALFDSMTVEENVGFPLKMFTNKTAAEIKERVDFVIQRVNLTNAHYKKPSELSGGMQKRVAIARAIVNNPKYLFCDEPNSGLDPKTAILIDNLPLWAEMLSAPNNEISLMDKWDEKIKAIKECIE